MNKISKLFSRKKLAVSALLSIVCSQAMAQYDICVYGGTSAGVIAAYTAKQLGKSVLLIEPGMHLGGLSSGGLGYTDIGNKYAVTGLGRDFYRRVGRHYGKLEQWIFEPHVAEQIFKEYIREAKVPVFYQYRIAGVIKKQGKITQITVENSSKPGKPGTKTISANVFIDCSYEGDLMAKAGVSYTIGREANSEYNETFNGVQLMDGHQLPDGIDPYKIPGDPASGLLWGISQEALAPNGSGDNKVQAYNFRICLTDSAANRNPITKPSGYDAAKYELLLRLMAKKPWKRFKDGFIWSGMPNRKTDINNYGGFSTDMIGANYAYPDGSYATRDAIIQQHVSYTKGLLYFIGHDERVPQQIRQGMLQWGYPKDEYRDNDNWSTQLYIREARRMKGLYVMTQANCQGKVSVTDPVGMAAYTMDSHNCERMVVGNYVKNEGNVEKGGFGPYGISYRALVPQRAECTNLIVPVCLSATHIAYGSIRMEPVFMVLAQSAAVAASLAVSNKKNVQDVPIDSIRNILRTNPLANHSTPEILVDNEDTSQVTVTGKWKLHASGGYGPSFLLSDDAATATVTFRPHIVTTGNYAMYIYLPRITNAAAVIPIRVFDGEKTAEIHIPVTRVEVLGQTNGEWVSIGNYALQKNKPASVSIINDSTEKGTVVADAVLLIPVR